MNKQVLSAEQMWELIDMGIDTSNANLYWYIDEEGSNARLLFKDVLGSGIETHSALCIPTFTIHDILDMLPNTIEWKGKTYWFSVFINGLGNKMIGYRDSELWTLEFKYFNINGAFDILKWCKQNNKL